MEVYRGRSLARWSPSTPVVADAASGAKPSTADTIHAGGPRGCGLGATAEDCPTGLGRSSAATPSAVLLTRPWATNPWVRAASAAAAGPLSRQEDPSRPLRRGHPKPGARANASIVSNQEIPYEKTVAVGFHEQLPYARRRLDRISIGCVAAPGAGDAFPRGRNLGHAVLGARPAGRWAVPGAQARTHPAHRPPKERHSSGRRYPAQPGHPSGSGERPTQPRPSALGREPLGTRHC